MDKQIDNLIFFRQYWSMDIRIVLKYPNTTWVVNRQNKIKILKPDFLDNMMGVPFVGNSFNEKEDIWLIIPFEGFDFPSIWNLLAP